MPWEIDEDRPRGAGASCGIRSASTRTTTASARVANTLAAVRAGAVQVQGTINGYGERCGNANLCSIIPDLELKLGLRCLPDGQLAELSEVAHFVAEVANLAPDEHLAYVGKSRVRPQGRRPRGRHAAQRRRATSTSIPSWSATRCASW